MIKINGKEYGLFFSIGANVAFNNWVIAHKDQCYIEGELQKAIFMMKAYNDAHDIKDKVPDIGVLMCMPNSELQAILEAVKQQETADTERKVEAEPVASKNAESASRSS